MVYVTGVYVMSCQSSFTITNEVIGHNKNKYVLHYGAIATPVIPHCAVTAVVSGGQDILEDDSKMEVHVNIHSETMILMY